VDDQADRLATIAGGKAAQLPSGSRVGQDYFLAPDLKETYQFNQAAMFYGRISKTNGMSSQDQRRQPVRRVPYNFRASIVLFTCDI
jgi:hypothetical protein